MTDADTPRPEVPPTDVIVAELRGLVASLPTQADADRAMHIEADVRRVLRWLIIPVVASTLFIIFTAWATLKGNAETTRNRQFQACMMAQQAEDRVHQHAVHETLGTAHGVAIPNGTLLPIRPDAAELHRVCDRFFVSEGASRQGR